MIYYLIKCIFLHNCLSRYVSYILFMKYRYDLDTITNTFLIFIIDTNTNVSTILMYCLNIY